ncbi:MAG TPA: SDR family oxidoreductase [Lautropia sp.]|nr:SDR family oxidoreductase [Lautropia sp.]
MSHSLEGRTALVFGAGSVSPGWGNGKASAVAYARAGANVVCVDWNAEAAEETVAIILGEKGVAQAASCDVTKEDQVVAVVQQCVSAFGTIDILHNNVGHAKIGGPVDFPEAEWQRQLDLNVTGVFLACKHVIPVMLKAGRGVITNISSVAGWRYTGYDYPSYYASKGAINQFTVGLALQYAKQGIRANAIMPGLMDTPHIYQHIAGAYVSQEEMVQQRHAACPTGRMGTGWDIAHAAVFLAGDGAQYINGVCLPVDGGLSARIA